jgi:hypothetical protein
MLYYTQDTKLPLNLQIYPIFYNVLSPVRRPNTAASFDALCLMHIPLQLIYQKDQLIMGEILEII